MQAEFQERRQTVRARVIYGGSIAFNQRKSTLECIIQNYSEAGAKLKLDNPALLPDRIDLLIERKGRAYAAKIVWRNEIEAGVSFRPVAEDHAPISLDWARRLRDCESERRVLKARITQLMSEH